MSDNNLSIITVFEHFFQVQIALTSVSRIKYADEEYKRNLH